MDYWIVSHGNVDDYNSFMKLSTHRMELIETEKSESQSVHLVL